MWRESVGMSAGAWVREQGGVGGGRGCVKEEREGPSGGREGSASANAGVGCARAYTHKHAPLVRLVSAPNHPLLGFMVPQSP